MVRTEKEMTPVQKALAIREGGNTIRCHTQQYIGSYNVAMHSFNALSLLLLLYPGTVRSELVRAVLWHDVPERWTGDIPAPAKWASMSLKEVLVELEQKVLDRLGLSDLFNLTEQEHKWLWSVDLLELYMWGKDQVALGNNTVQGLLNRVEDLFIKSQEKLPLEVIGFLAKFEWQRTPELNEL
jgi:hypothetical protein